MYYLYLIGKLRKYLADEQTNIMIRVQATSTLDQNNSPFIAQDNKCQLRTTNAE